MWQFMPATGRSEGLRIDNWVDERLDPELATRAADPSPGEDGGKLMRLQIAADGSEVDVRQWEISRGQIQSLSEALQELLYCEATD